MLTHQEVTSSTRAKDYFATSVSAAAIGSRRDYYAEGQESAGWYGGKLGAELGLVGKPVDQETFHRLCDNRHPFEDRPLTPRTNEFRRVCYDFTISGPKSISVIEALASDADRKALRGAFDEAVKETVAEDMEPDMHCRERRNGADHDIRTGNVLTAIFPHGTARPEDANALSDPHWHYHVLIWNATRRADGRIMAGQFGDMVRDKPYYRAAFYARLAEKLEALGYVIDRRANGDWEIAGVPQSVIDTFSKRTAQINAEAIKRGIADPAIKASLGAKLRAKKLKDLTMPELRAAWDAQLTDGERDALAKVYRREASAGEAVTPEACVRFALAHVSEQLSVFPEREVKRVALLHGLGSVTPEMIGREMQHPRHGLFGDTIDRQRMVTTERLQAEEDEIIRYAARGLGAVAPVGVPDDLSRQRPDGKTLNDGQWAAARGLLDAENRYNVLLGPAGSGKTDMLKTYASGMATAGEQVGFFATTSDAVDVLHKDGFADAKTVAHFLLDERLQNSLRNGYVVVDETSMLGHKDALRFFRLAEKLNLKVTFVGDPMQHGSVPRGSLLRILKDYAGLREFRLKAIMRQRHDGYRAAVESLAEGRTLEGFEALDSLGWVSEIEADGERVQALAADYVQAVKDQVSCLVVSPTHAEAAAITDEIRSQLRVAGLLGQEDHAFTRLVAVNASEAERGQASTYGSGPLVLQFHQNAKGHTKGDRLVVNDAAAVPLSEASKFSLYKVEKFSLAAGDRIRFTGTVKTLDGHALKNGMVKSIAEINGDKITLDNCWVIDGRSAGHFRHGFVDTSFGSQGKTVRRVLLGMSAASARAMNQENMYVSASRGKDWLRLYTDSKAAVRSAIGKSSQKLAALDLRRASPPPKATPLRQEWDRLKRHWERRRRLAHYDGLRPPAGRMTHRPDRMPPVVGSPTHAERMRHQQQQREVGHER